jgi:nitroreductase
MDFTQLMKNRRSIRQYEDKPVPLETIQNIIHQSCLSPSSGNRQEWRFVIVNNREMMRRISDESKSNAIKDIESDPNAYMRRYETILRNKDHNVFFNAPCLIIILGPKDNHTLQIDCTLIASYIMFSAVEKGLGTCWIGMGQYIKDPALLAELGITEDLQIVAPIVLGYPKQIPEAVKRKEPQILRVIT